MVKKGDERSQAVAVWNEEVGSAARKDDGRCFGQCKASRIVRGTGGLVEMWKRSNVKDRRGD